MYLTCSFPLEWWWHQNLAYIGIFNSEESNGQTRRRSRKFVLPFSVIDPSQTYGQYTRAQKSWNLIKDTYPRSNNTLCMLLLTNMCHLKAIHAFANSCQLRGADTANRTAWYKITSFKPCNILCIYDVKQALMIIPLLVPYWNMLAVVRFSLTLKFEEAIFSCAFHWPVSHLIILPCCYLMGAQFLQCSPLECSENAKPPILIGKSEMKEPHYNF